MKWILILVTVLYSSFGVSSSWQYKKDFAKLSQSKLPTCEAAIEYQTNYIKFNMLPPPRFAKTIVSVTCDPKEIGWGNIYVRYEFWYLDMYNNECADGLQPDYPDTECKPEPEPPPPPENKCKVPAGEILARRSGIEGANGRYYCVKQCSGIAKQVGDMCIAVGDGPNICDYELISSGVDCDGNGDGSTDGDGSGNPPPPPEPIPPETGDGSNDNGDGSLEPDINGDGSGGSGDINGDGTINGADYGGNLAKIVENTAKTAVAVNTNTNMITDAINKQTKAITDAVNNGNGSGNGSGTPDGDGDGEADSVNGGSCEQFVCNGPAVQCYIAQKQWEQKCDIEGVIAQNEKPVIDGINTFINDNPITNIEAGTLDISTYFNKYDGSNGIQTGGSCPAPISISLGEYGSHTVKLDPLCELAVIIRVFLQITAVVSVGLMFAKYS
ncbi:TPA: virulence factor TspB C-terminal domain-related protein [Photobacterium damselae]